ncbi:LapA family protein [Methylobacterium sp. J-077]|uniref:LapA family protein n=1 Tax=Methylobacterium sp. J-077 TaxID=2836656 RepID=UPI001FBADA04|nr:LapA family protein [Methylobacterium sp. J-077]MCJ2126057.1 LapA family protein [Methylobacterium sp. J-077]
MIRFLKSLVLLPIAALVILLAVANRAPVPLSFDPFNADAPVFSVDLPLYAILFGAVALGIVVGGIFTWLGQGKTRANVRYHRREATRYEREATRLRAYAPESETQGTAYTVPNTNRTALPAPR